MVDQDSNPPVQNVLEDNSEVSITDTLGKQDDSEGMDVANNPFLWQVYAHFDGLLQNVMQFDENQLDANLQQLVTAIAQMNEEGFFKEYEQDIQDAIKQELKEHAYNVLAFELINVTDPKYAPHEIQEIIVNTNSLLLNLLTEILGTNAQQNPSISEQGSIDHEALIDVSQIGESIYGLSVTVQLSKELAEYSQDIELYTLLKDKGKAANNFENAPHFLDKKSNIRDILKSILHPPYIGSDQLKQLSAENFIATLQLVITKSLENVPKDYDDLSHEERKNLGSQANMLCKNDDDPLWTCYLQDELDQITYIPRPEGFLGKKNPVLHAFQQNNATIIPSRVGFLKNNPQLVQQLKNLELQEKLVKIKQKEDYLIQKYLPKCTRQFQELEQANPGFLIQLINLLSQERYRIKNYGNWTNGTVSAEDKSSYNNMITNNQLAEALSDFKDLKRELNALNTQLKEIIEKERFHYYINKLKERENEKLKQERQRRFDAEWAQYQSSIAEIQANPRNTEWDNESITLPPAPTMPCLQRGYYSRPMFNDLTNLKNLIQFSRGSNGLNWLIHHKVEYDFEVINDLIIGLKNKGIGIESDLLSFILEHLVFNRDYPDNELSIDDFISKAIIRNIDQLRTSSSSSSAAAPPNVKQKLQKEINDRFALLQPLINDGLFEQIIAEYNNAYEEANLLIMQKLWAIFARTQYLINKNNYNNYLQQEYTAYKEAQETYYMRIYPAADTHKLIYPSKTPNKIAELNITPIFDELTRVGNAAKASFTHRNAADQTNLVTATFYFLVSDKPHDPNIKDHKRIYLPVQINFPNIPNVLLSLDTDEVYLKKNELENHLTPQNQDEKTLLYLLHVQRVKKFRELADTLIADKFKALENIPLDSKQAYLTFIQLIQQNNLLPELIAQIRGGKYLAEFEQYLQDNKLALKINDRRRMQRTVQEFASDLENKFFIFFANKHSLLDHTASCDIIKQHTNLDYRQLFYANSEHPEDHSERVLLQLLKDDAYCEYIVQSLENALRAAIKGNLTAEEKHKVYLALLFLHSSNSICNNCTLSLIGLQNSHFQGFLNKLINRLNSDTSPFKVRGYEEGDLTKFHLTTLVEFNQNLTEQAHHITGEQQIQRRKKQEENPYYTSQGRLKFLNNSINIKNPKGYNGQFFEFRTNSFQDRLHSNDKSGFQYNGIVFMSGSKNAKLKKPEEIEKVEAEIKRTILRG